MNSAERRGSGAAQVPWADFHRKIDARMGQLEGEVQRVHDEVEACSVLVLSLDASAVNGTAGNTAVRSGGDTDVAVAEAVQAEAARLTARIEVLEHAWANRGAAVARDIEDALARLEREMLEIWRQVRAQEDAHLPPLRDLTREVQSGLQDVKQQVESVREEMLQDRGNLDQNSIDDLVKNLTKELGRTAADFERRCDRLEEGVARMEAGEVAIRADRQRASELERMVELLVQQRREDILATNAQLREIDAQLRQIREGEEREINWRNEAAEIRGELEDMKIVKIPAIASQSSRASQLIAEGLQALRKEVQDLRDRKDPGSKKEIDETASLEAGLEVARVKAEVEDLRQQVTKALVGGFEDRMLVLRADFAAEVEGAIREVRETWADTSRRLAALEPWQKESAQLHAEMRQLKIERQEDGARLNVKVQDELLAQRAAIVEGLESRLAGFRHDLGVNPTKAIRALSPGPNSGTADSGGGIIQGILGSSRTAGAGGAPVVLGTRIEWALSAAQVVAGSRTRAGGKKPEPLVTGELEIAGIRCRLKFYPKGSPLRTVEGNCSLYLLALVPVAVRFHLFAGSHVSPLLECSYDRRRDQGRHDLCILDEVLDADGGIVIGAELLDVQPLMATVNS